MNIDSFGQSALAFNVDGADNSAFGSFALVQNTSGSGNAAFGRDALSRNTTGTENVAFGVRALDDFVASRNSAFGYEALAQRARETGVCAFIVPDLPYEESAEINSALEKEGVGLIQLVTPATPDDRLKMLADASRGFLYAVTITGITGGDTGLPADLADYLDTVSRVSPVPVCAGFGIRAAADVASVGQHAAGAIVGSALVEVLERGEDPRLFLEALRP